VKCMGGRSRPMSAAPRVRRLANQAPEPSSQMRLITHPTAHGDAAQGVRGAQHQLLGQSDPSMHHVKVRGKAKRARKGSAEVARTKTHGACDVPDSQSLPQIFFNVLANAPDLPRREAAPNNLGCRTRGSRQRATSREIENILDQNGKVTHLLRDQTARLLHHLRRPAGRLHHADGISNRPNRTAKLMRQKHERLVHGSSDRAACNRAVSEGIPSGDEGIPGGAGLAHGANRAASEGTPSGGGLRHSRRLFVHAGVWGHDGVHKGWDLTGIQARGRLDVGI
jgi:hypothetical protein